MNKPAEQIAEHAGLNTPDDGEEVLPETAGAPTGGDKVDDTTSDTDSQSPNAVDVGQEPRGFPPSNIHEDINGVKVMNFWLKISPTTVEEWYNQKASKEWRLSNNLCLLTNKIANDRN